MGQCLGACFRDVPVQEYNDQISRIKKFLDGDTKIVKKQIAEKMQVAASSLEFERAADLRDQLKYIDETVESQRVLSKDTTPRDLFKFPVLFSNFIRKKTFKSHAKFWYQKVLIQKHFLLF